jgi:cAMP-binding proteins - catabolite gene activator and regulatory subunit of cAMP-dependent protein kinases
MATTGDTATRLTGLSSALAPIFCGRFCDIPLPNHVARTFAKDEAMYDLGDRERTLFFVRRGVVKTGTITENGREIIYDIRKPGDVAGELCCLERPRRDRAVAVEATEAVPVSFGELMDTLSQHPTLLRSFVEILTGALAEAYDQVQRLADDNVMERLIKVLKTLAAKLGRPSGRLTEIDAYLTQKELSAMVVARRERTSTALNFLRRHGIAQYSSRGHLLIDMPALESHEFLRGVRSPFDNPVPDVTSIPERAGSRPEGRFASRPPH